MPPAIPANDAARMSTREMLGLSLMNQHPRVGSMSVAWDVAAQCLANGDAAGFDAAMKIFRELGRKCA